MFLTLLLITFGLAISQECLLTLHSNPLSSYGLSIPFLKSSNCSSDIYAEAIILEPITREYLLYNPIITNNTSKVVPQPFPKLQKNNIIISIWFFSDSPFILSTSSSLCFSLPNVSFAYCNTEKFYSYIESGIVPVKSYCPSIRDFPMQLHTQMRKFNETNYIFNNYINRALNCSSLTGINIITNLSEYSIILNQIQAIEYGAVDWTFFPDITNIKEANFLRTGLGQNTNNYSYSEELFIFCNGSNKSNVLFLYNNYQELYMYTSPDPIANNLLNYLAYIYVKNWENECMNITAHNYSIEVYYNNEGVIDRNNIKSLFIGESNDNNNTNENSNNNYSYIVYLLLFAFGFIFTLIFLWNIYKRNPRVQHQDEKIEVVDDEEPRTDEIEDYTAEIVSFYMDKFLNISLDFENHKKEIEKDRLKSREQLAIKLSTRKNSTLYS